MVRSLGAGLADAVEPVAVGRILIGINWTMVEAETGTGLAQSPARDAPSCRPLEAAGHYGRCPLDRLARLVEAGNPFERVIGVAAINAFYNRPALAGSADNGLDGLAASDGPVVVIGRFPGLDERLPGAMVIERRPRPGDYPESAASYLLPSASVVVITASTLVNGSLDRLAAHARHARKILVGPGTPLAPALFDAGFDRLSGLVVDQVDMAARVVAEAGAVRALKRCGRYVTLERA
jgi:uncharacterized protein (DUF4213/DUF364 family)